MRRKIFNPKRKNVVNVWRDGRRVIIDVDENGKVDFTYYNDSNPREAHAFVIHEDDTADLRKALDAAEEMAKDARYLREGGDPDL